MLDGTYNMTIAACGVTVGGQVAATAIQGIEPVDTVLPVGHAGALTRSDSDTGVVTLTAGHDIVTAKVDIHWLGGCRYNMDGVVTNTNTLTVDGGAGDNLPAAAATPVVATPAVSLDVSFDGDNLVLIGVGSVQQAHVRFVDVDTVTVGTPFLLAAGGVWGWASGLGSASPLAGNAIVAAQVSNGSATATSTFRMTGLQHAT